MKWLIVLILLLPSITHATDYYAFPGGSGDACSFNSPCTLSTALQNADQGGDHVILKNGTYHGKWATLHNGAAGNPIVIRALNRRQAILRFNGANETPNDKGFDFKHDNITFRGIEVWCTEPNTGDATWDCFTIHGTTNNLTKSQWTAGNFTNNIIIEDVYVHHSGRLLTGCWSGRNVIVRNSYFFESATQDDWGSANYLSSSGTSGNAYNPCENYEAHNNVYGKFRPNAIDMKDQTRTVRFHHNIWYDKKPAITNPNYYGDGEFRSANNQGNGITSSGQFINDNIYINPGAQYIFRPDGHRFDGLRNVFVNPRGPKLLADGNTMASAVFNDNITCPSTGIVIGSSGHGTNQLNRPQSECNTRSNVIIGQPAMLSCEIGEVDNKTVVVHFQADTNGPVSAASGLQVTYDDVSQTVSSTTGLPSLEATLTVANTASAATVVKVTSPIGSITNSAYIGGLSCGNVLNGSVTSGFTPGVGFCGTNPSALTKTCTNTISGGPLPTAALDQAAWRFYAPHNAQGTAPLAPENTNIISRLGAVFRWRVGVRGGVADAPERSYALATRLCNPTCGSWAPVTADFATTGLSFIDDQVQQHGAATTNQLSLGGKSFLAGSFRDAAGFLPAVAIASTQQIEWEVSLRIAPDNTPVDLGDTIQLRIQEDNGTALSAYTLPSITIGSAVSSYSGSITGTIK